MLSQVIDIVPQSMQTESFRYRYNEILTNGEGYLLKKYLKPNQTLFDVGANVGEWSLTALQLEPSLRVICFEPIPSIFEKLYKNLSAKTSQIHNLAVSDHLGESDFYFLDEEDSGLSSLFKRPVFSKYDLKNAKVRLETLDHFCQMNQIDAIDFLKIDVEGGELGVLKGASHLLKAQKIKALQMEYGETYFDAGITLKETMKFLTDSGYVLFRIWPEALVHMTNWQSYLENYVYCNYFAILQSEVPGYSLMAF